VEIGKIYEYDSFDASKFPEVDGGYLWVLDVDLFKIKQYDFITFLSKLPNNSRILIRVRDIGILECLAYNKVTIQYLTSLVSLCLCLSIPSAYSGIVGSIYDPPKKVDVNVQVLGLIIPASYKGLFEVKTYSELLEYYPDNVEDFITLLEDKVIKHKKLSKFSSVIEAYAQAFVISDSIFEFMDALYDAAFDQFHTHIYQALDNTVKDISTITGRIYLENTQFPWLIASQNCPGTFTQLQPLVPRYSFYGICYNVSTADKSYNRPEVSSNRLIILEDTKPGSTVKLL